MIRIIFPLLFAIATLLGSAQAAEPVALADDAPDSYEVKRGDTLWDISGRFLRQPWRWPEVWRLNRDQIRNPHLIYPGQLIVLDRSGPWLSIGRRVGMRDDKMLPQVYSEPLDKAIPSIPLHAIEAFLTQPLVTDEARLAASGTIVATETSRVYMGAGDTVFAKDVAAGVDDWLVYRSTQPLVDPETKEVLGHESVFLGTAKVTAHGTPATLRLTSANEEIGTGDKLVPSEKPTTFSYVPHAPQKDIAGRVVAIHRGVQETGRHYVITIGAGARDGVERGHVLALHRNRGTAVYKDPDGGKESFELPEQRYGLAFVFRVFDRVAYALVMETDGSVVVGDSARKP